MTAPRLLLRPIEAFVRTEGSGGIVLFVAAVAAVAWANAGADSYADVWAWSHPIRIFTLHRHFEVIAFVNDGLMAVFFYLVGLEVKRELIEGELNSLKKAALPGIAALGGMVAPALIFTGFNAGGQGAHGWGIPMATDIAFAIGALALLGTRVPFGLKAFLLALAIADDIGAILVIAIFYSASIDAGMLVLAAACLAAIVLAQRRGLRQWQMYLVLGLGAWLATLESGVHATIAGVALGLLTSARPPAGGDESALDRTERVLHPWVSYAIVPVFALANAGVVISGNDLRAAVTSDIALGIGLGLLAGKPVGILSASWLAVRLRLAELPADVSWRQLAGVGMLGGIGFTVSLFITALAFEPAQFIDDAKIGIFAASILSAIVGLGYLGLIAARAPRNLHGDVIPAVPSGDDPVS